MKAYTPLFLLLTLASIAFSAGKDSVSYAADRVVYTRKDSLITLIGNAQVSYESMNLTADTIYYYTATSIMLSSGNPILIDRNDTITGHYISYNLDNRSGKLISGHLKSPDQVYYSGEEIVYSGDSAIYIHNGTYTTCMHTDDAHSCFYSEKLKVLPQDKALASPFVLDIGDAPVAVVPLFIVPLKKSRRNGWLAPRWGVGLDGKGSVDNIGYFWAPSDYVDFLVAGKIDNFDSFLIKGKTRYKVKDKLSGSFYGDYLLNDKYQGSSTRWSIKFTHDQNLLPDRSLTLRGSGQIVSDQNYYKDTKDDEIDELLNQQFTSNLTLTKQFLNVGGYATLSWKRSQNLKSATTSQDLPSFQLSLNRRNFLQEPISEAKRTIWHDLGFQYSLKANQQFSSKYDNTDTTKQTTIRGAGHTLALDMPTTIFRYLRLTPRFVVNQSFHDTWFSKDKRDSLVTDTIWEDTLHIDDTLGLPPGTIIDTLEGIDSIRYNPHDSLYTISVTDTFTIYDVEDSLKDNAHNIWWNTGVSLTTDIYGTYNFSGKRLKAIRHTFTPSLTYTFTPENDLNYRFPSIGGILAPQIVEHQRQDLSISLRNYFEAKSSRPTDDGKEPIDRKVQLFNFDIRGSYNFEGGKGDSIYSSTGSTPSTKWHNLSLSGQIPTPVFSLTYNSNYTAYDRYGEGILPKPLTHNINVSPKLPSLSGNVWNGDFFTLEKATYDGYMDNLYKNKPTWRMTLSPRFTYAMSRKYSDDYFKTAQTYNLSTNIKINFSQRWAFNWGATYSFTENEFINQRVGLYADLECWELKLDWYPTGVASGKVYFTAQLKKHRDIKWEQKER